MATRARAIRNRATEVAPWDVVEASAGGDAGADERHRVASATRGRLDTANPIGGFVDAVAVDARDRTGRELGRSQVAP
jgi:hypothetical protein